MISSLIANKSLTANATFTLARANSNGADDILVFNEDKVHVETLHGLRQQAQQKENSSSYFCLADFVAPKVTEREDYIGMFCCTIRGVDEVCAKFEEALDDYKWDLNSFVVVVGH